MAHQLLEQGFYVYLRIRNLQNNQEAVEALKSVGLNQMEVIEIDASNPEYVKEFYDFDRDLWSTVFSH
jgi:short-subunit dehydrogenase